MASFRVYSLNDTNQDTVYLTGDNTVLIRNYSTAEIIMEITSGVINLDTVFFSNGNARVFGESVGYGIKATFPNVESGTFTVTAEDDEGRIVRQTVTTSMVDYVNLTCNISNNRPDGDGKMALSCSGTYFNGSFGAVNNTLSVMYRYKANGGSFSAWNSMTVTKYSGSYYAYAELTGLDYQKIYSFEVVAQDKLRTVTASTNGVTSRPIFHWGESDFVFEVPVTAGEVNFSNEANSTTLISTYSDGSMVLQAPRIYFIANQTYLGSTQLQTAQRGSWTPTLFSGAVGYYSTQKGWYTKVGSTVTIGFNIKAICNSGSESYDVSITGLPYTPSIQAAGGGMCSGAYVSGGYTFQCFVAETTGMITVRTQACNNTSAANLSTSASGCKYPSGGGTLTISGTITYETV